jgi:hypothetical protein
MSAADARKSPAPVMARRPFAWRGGVKHATAASLDRLERLLGELRGLGALKEKARGVFYLRSKAALHFHEDPAGLFVDIRTGPEWERMAVNTGAEQARLLRIVAEHVRGS